MIPSRKKIQRMIDQTFDGYHRAASQKGRVSFPDVDDIINKANKNTIVALQHDLDKPLSSSPNAGNLRLQTYQVASDRSTGVYRRYRPSSRIENLAKPLARLRKPSIRLNAVFRGVDNNKIPWSKKGPNVPNEKPRVVNLQAPPPLPPQTKTGVSQAALKYEASEHIKRLAQHRPNPKPDDKNKCFLVKPLSLIYKPSLRIQQLSKPRIRIVKT